MPNRLADEASPYLQQHADNPVEWYPWGDQAFERAEEEDRPILLSIGYSSCHWCHVMAHESFEDPGVAELMNESFVNVKVDREERPDVDSLYMKAVQSMSGQGGWPLTVFLTPDGIPYFGGTYFPPEPRPGTPSFRQVLRAARNAFDERRDEVEEAANDLVEALRRATTDREEGSGAYGPEGDTPDRALLRHAEDVASERFDAIHGGFGSAPKFPQAPTLDYLLRRSRGREGARSRQMVEHTLRRMARGGIRDHLGGGFHRYSVDQRWLVPHFEKMLYDNALLARLYVDAWRATGDPEFRAVAVDTVEWMLRDLRDPEGAFHAALDADTEGEEGRHYVWDASEVDRLLDPAEARAIRAFHGVEDDGNWEGVNVLHQTGDPEEVAGELGLEADELRDLLEAARRTLLERREERQRPFRDEKVLAGWNGLAVRALAEGGAALGRPEWIEAADETAGFLLEALTDGEGGLRHVWKDGRARVPAFLDDYASLGLALLSLHGATLDPRWLVEARKLLEALLERFWDEDRELLFDAPSDGEELLIRPRDPMDNPAPSGTSMAAELLLRGAVIFGEDRYRDRARRVLAREAGAIERYPLAFGALLSALDLHLSGAVEVALVGDPGSDDARDLLRTVHERYLPTGVVVGRAPATEMELEVPLLEGRGLREGRPTAYVCRDYACREPVTDAGALATQLAEADDLRRPGASRA